MLKQEARGAKAKARGAKAKATVHSAAKNSLQF